MALYEKWKEVAVKSTHGSTALPKTTIVYADAVYMIPRKYILSRTYKELLKEVILSHKYDEVQEEIVLWWIYCKCRVIEGLSQRPKWAELARQSESLLEARNK